MSMTIRGCGTRVVGAVYLSVNMSESGESIERFLIDPPQVVVPADIGLSAIGTILVERNAHTHVIDMVGQESYPNVADYLEEAKRYGLSRRISRMTDFSRLGMGSRLILAHARAHIDNADEYQRSRPESEFWCACDRSDHLSNVYRKMCAALWWEDVEGGVAASDPYASVGCLCGKWPSDVPGAHMHRRRREGRSVVRSMPSFDYRALCRPEGITPHYRPALFASFPIGALHVIRDPEGGTHVDALERTSRSTLPVELHDE